MFDRFFNAPWWQISNFLMQGNPPVIVELMAINTIFLMLYIVRKARGASTIRGETLIQVQALVIFANVLLLFQEQIVAAMRMVI